MKKIILASNSTQRKRLMKFFGFDFKVHPSQVDEVSNIHTTPATLVKHNALLKAQDVARHYKDGIIIGSDTVVYVGNKRMVLKPKTLKEAKKNLKLLFTKPQMVYSGVALIDAKTKKKLVGYEKTKVFMTHLSDEEIDRYYTKVNPLDKAGGFDIEGWGSIFIRRIEGCYTNVIGLPMAKLSQMLKKMGVQTLCALLLFSLFGCTSEFNLATQEQESYLISEDREVEIGDKVAQKIEEHFKIVEDVEENERVQNILNRIVAVCDRRDILYFIKIIDEDTVNASALPGGRIYVFKGLLDKVKSDDQLAGVIAHEVGHITARHGIKRMQESYRNILIQIAAIEAGADAAVGTNAILATLFFANSQDAEMEADRLGVKYMKAAGYDPNEMLSMLELLKAEQDKAPSREFSYWKTHPNPAKRMAIVHEAITGKMRFKDYLNVTGETY